MEDLNFSCWLRPGPAPAILGVWGMNQQISMFAHFFSTNQQVRVCAYLCSLCPTPHSPIPASKKNTDLQSNVQLLTLLANSILVPGLSCLGVHNASLWLLPDGSYIWISLKSHLATHSHAAFPTQGEFLYQWQFPKAPQMGKSACAHFLSVCLSLGYRLFHPPSLLTMF